MKIGKYRKDGRHRHQIQEGSQLYTEPANKVEPAEACTNCGCRNADRLEITDAAIDCTSCGHSYKI